jgi:pantoate--beta-alanine ligase
MKIFKSKYNLKKEISKINNLSFVPTMGGLHKGHISLIKKTKAHKGPCLVSIFVNPKQFNKKKDFKSYPKNIKKDLKLLKKLKVNLVYLPKFNDIFSFKPKNKIFLNKFNKKLCGKFRKGHFKGVLNVVNRLLDITQPKYLFLGKKDYQQLYLISEHVQKNNIQTKIIACKTIRENNGMACSTRNENIQEKHIKIASKVYWYMRKKKKMIKKNLKNFNYINLKKDLIKLGLKKIDYIKLYNIKTFNKPKKKSENFRIFVAYYLGNIRLIDNI